MRARSGQLVRHRHDGRVVAHREVRRLDERPGQVLVAALGIACSLFLAVRFAPGVHRARAGRGVDDSVEAADVPGLQRNSQRLTVRSQLGLGQDAALQWPVRCCLSSTLTTLLSECKSIPAYSSMSAPFVGARALWNVKVRPKGHRDLRPGGRSHPSNAASCETSFGGFSFCQSAPACSQAGREEPLLQHVFAATPRSVPPVSL